MRLSTPMETRGYRNLFCAGVMYPEGAVTRCHRFPALHNEPLRGRWTRPPGRESGRCFEPHGTEGEPGRTCAGACQDPPPVLSRPGYSEEI